MDIPEYKPKDKPPAGKSATATKQKKPLPADRPLKATLPQIRKALENALAMTIMSLSTAAAFTQNETAEKDAATLTEHGEELIDKWVWLAERNATIRRWLEILCGGGGALSFVMVNAMVMADIADNHGWYPEGVPKPSSLKTLMVNMYGGKDENGDDEPDTED